MNPPADPAYVPALAYHRLTPFYDAVVGTTTRERTFKRALIEQACIQPAHQVLDLASGTGTLAIWIQQQEPRAHVTGIDGDAAILSIARRKAQRAGVTVVFDQGLSYALPYEDERFDRVLSSLFFHHLAWSSKQRTARELFRVLKRGTELHVADWGAPGSALMRLLYRATIQVLDGVRNTQDNVDGRLIELFAGAGFVDVVQRNAFSTVYGTMALYSARKPAA